MSFGYSVGDLIAVSSLVFQASNILSDFKSPEAKYVELGQHVDELGKTFLEIESIGLDNFEKAEVDTIQEISRISEEFAKALLGPLTPTNSETGKTWWLRWKRKKKRTFPRPARLPELVAQSSGAAALSRALLEHVKNLERPRTCLLIFAMFVSFVGLSCFLGTYFTVNKRYSYSMGDAFTLAGYVITVGACVSSDSLIQHYRQCRCWERVKAESTGSSEMKRLTSR
ncbi:hypothetical protein D0Z07_8562 [Hyphodiscus hymeniophilus]|uniref:Uncharacterized protein n=1 Tax=Hyphodiscus hymeniophilus TaxID=353542 RepID=A0A9P6SLN5_9HELO|nr:hypothetical protein D0Z07_8562 [Hyphodiscus hymeniophilus]